MKSDHSLLDVKVTVLPCPVYSHVLYCRTVSFTLTTYSASCVEFTISSITFHLHALLSFVYLRLSTSYPLAIYRFKYGRTILVWPAHPRLRTVRDTRRINLPPTCHSLHSQLTLLAFHHSLVRVTQSDSCGGRSSLTALLLLALESASIAFFLQKIGFLCPWQKG